DIIHMRKVDEAKKKNDELAETKVNDYLLGDNVNLQTNDPKTQQFELLKLGKTPTGSISFPHQSDRQANRVKPLVQEKFEDLVGELLEEADELKEKYDTYNLNYAGGINEPG